ncbi:MAG: hypothetical protein MUF00_18890 [Gemmatimonadaceae bacterium]|nr:hypothetical protein [Gemmatimonadaceae bacterium]
MPLTFRLASWLFRRGVPLLPAVLERLLYLTRNCDIPASTRIGEGSYLAHRGVGVVINGLCSIGERVSLGQGITIGGTFGSGVPTIGSDVWISAGARVLGEIRVGDNVIIGANAVVIRDVPDNSVVAGVPARVIRTIAPGSLDTRRGLLLS